MKKSRIAKFALLGASAAALAATLSTSTYAWYVSSQTTNTNTLTGGTSTAGADGSITLSLDGKKGTFFPTITLPAFDSANKLAPITTTDGKTFTTLAGTAAPATSYYHFTFYILSETTQNVTPKITIVNDTATAKSQVNYFQGDDDDNPITTSSGKVGKGQTFQMDALNAMYISQTQGAGTDISSLANNTAPTYAAAGTALGGAVYGTGKSPLVDSSSNYPTTYTVATGGAHDYYDAIMDTDLTTAQKTLAFGTNTLTGDLSLTAMVPVRLDYYVWLDGADDQCFNCCAGQDVITFNFEYTVAA